MPIASCDPYINNTSKCTNARRENAMSNKQKIKWLLFHEPAELFIRTAEHFEKEINRLTGDRYEIEIMKLEDYNEKYNNGKPCDPITELKENRVQMSQLYSNSLASTDATDFYALALPFLFKDHDHCARVLEGEIGDELMAHLHDRLQVKGLSFTYSGGYKCMATDKQITSIDQLENMTVKHKQSPVFTEMFRALGMDTADDANMTQTTLPRYHVEASESQKHVIDTQHSMYLTTILMNDDMWADLSVDDQMHFREAAKICARAERAKSVADAEEIKNDASKQAERGIETIGDLEPAEIEKLKAKLVPVTDKFAKFFGNDLVDRIRKS
jgi:TRAP-type C4-dicarboxylate transport system substrate-binding protein